MTTAFVFGRRIIGLLIACLMLSGCSALKLGYNTLPELAYWWLDRSLAFNDEQRPRVREDLAALHRWHRSAELPRFIDVLARLEQLAPGELTPTQACSVVDEVRLRLAALRRQAEPLLAATGATLGEQQLAHLARRQEHNLREFRRTWVRIDPVAREDKRVEQFQEHAERLYGRLEPAQRRVLRERIASSRFDGERIVAERARRQTDTLETLRQLRAPGLAPAQAQALVRAWLDRLEHSPDAQWRGYQQALQQEHCATFAQLHNAASAEQRARAAERLRGWQRDLHTLVDQS
ncbi:DUF6279 family lipoprotein [Ramlibacter sp. AN1015]|uniref:DUF6279 family lipoprotein n=1 Tax=Ramlibacter sp. AN1015 TaxID=3133428 RepID=UPI0030BF6155